MLERERGNDLIDIKPCLWSSFGLLEGIPGCKLVVNVSTLVRRWWKKVELVFQIVGLLWVRVSSRFGLQQGRRSKISQIRRTTNLFIVLS